MNINTSLGKAYYTLVSAKGVFRNCTWKFAEDNASKNDLLFTIKDGMLHHVRILIVIDEGAFLTHKWNQLYEDRDWIDMDLYRKAFIE